MNDEQWISINNQSTINKDQWWMNKEQWTMNNEWWTNNNEQWKVKDDNKQGSMFN